MSQYGQKADAQIKNLVIGIVMMVFVLIGCIALLINYRRSGHEENQETRHVDPNAPTPYEVKLQSWKDDLEFQKGQLKAATDRLEKYKNAPRTNVAIKRQFTIDSATGLAEFESSNFQEEIVILADPDELPKSPYGITIPIVKIDRRCVIMDHPGALTESESTSKEYFDYYLHISKSRLDAAQKEVEDLQKKIRELEAQIAN